MGRSAEVFVRPVTMTEGQRLQRIGRTARDPVKLRRAIVVLMSAQGQAVPDIAHPAGLLPGVRARGDPRVQRHRVPGTGPKWSGGRPRTISEHARRQICLLARCRPRDLGLAFSAWSLTKLAEHLVTTGVVARSRDQPAGHQDLEGLAGPGPGLHRQDAPGPGPVRSPARRRPGDLPG
jgi:hypothetical protein